MKICKILMFVPFVVVSGCKSYVNTVSDVYDGKKILVVNNEGEERLIDCSKKNSKNEQLLKDIPYFKAGDQIELKQAKLLGDNYAGRRVFTTEDYKVVYPADTIQIRKDREIIQKEKAAHTQIIR